MVATCFSDYAVKVSQSCCLSSDKTASSALNPIPSTQNAVISLYRTNLISTENQFLIRITWYKSFKVPGSIHSIDIFDDNLNLPQVTKISIDNRCFRKKIKGERTIEFCGFKIEIFWDLSLAKYDNGPEPISDFYLAVKFDSELGLFLGAMREESTDSKRVSFSLVSRTEHLHGNTQYSTKAQFCENGSAHDILIRCNGNGEEGRSSVSGPDPELSVCINDKQVIREERLQWNFRGNRTIYVDGLLVDLMWDVFDWFFNPVSGCGAGAVFLFRTRSGLQSGLWLEEKMLQKREEGVGFSLLIYASKSIVKKNCSRFID